MLHPASITNPCIAELLQLAEQQLQSSDTARLDAEVLLCHVAKLERTTLYAHPELILNENTFYAYQALIEARKNGQPVAYLTHTREFWSTHFKVSDQTLIPRQDTECLVECALEYIPDNMALRIADLGTGCGAIAISIAKERPQSHITATEISPEALHIARENAECNNIKNISFVLSNWFENIIDCFHLIVSNPPYIKEDDEHLEAGDVQHEPRLALTAGKEGLDAISQIVKNAPPHLFPNARLLLEHGFDQGEKVRLLMKKHGFTDTGTIKDYAGHERVSFGKLSI